jgi:hypothetical protein
LLGGDAVEVDFDAGEARIITKAGLRRYEVLPAFPPDVPWLFVI